MHVLSTAINVPTRWPIGLLNVSNILLRVAMKLKYTLFYSILFYHGIRKVYHGVNKVYHGIRKVYHDIRKIYHNVRKVYHGVRNVYHGVRKIYHSVRKVYIYKGIPWC